MDYYIVQVGQLYYVGIVEHRRFGRQKPMPVFTLDRNDAKRISDPEYAGKLANAFGGKVVNW